MMGHLDRVDEADEAMKRRAKEKGSQKRVYVGLGSVVSCWLKKLKVGLSFRLSATSASQSFAASSLVTLTVAERLD